MEGTVQLAKSAVIRQLPLLSSLVHDKLNFPSEEADEVSNEWII